MPTGNQRSTMAALAILLSGCSNDDPGGSTLTWQDCDDLPRLQCTTLDVPVDPAQPNGDRLALSLARRSADGTDRRGVLVLNPGGPGGSGRDSLAGLVERSALPDALTSHFDIVGFDPRGVGASAPVDCSDLDLIDPIGYLVDADAIDEAMTRGSQAAADCQDRYGDYLQQLGTMRVVDDLEAIRVALDEPTLNFLGYSYGTRIAALYLQRFPDRTGRFVLDASLPPQSGMATLATDVVPAMQTNLDAVLAHCTAVDPACDSGSLATRLQQRVDTLVTSATVDPAAEQAFALLGTLILASAQDRSLGEQFLPALMTYLDSDDATVLEAFLAQVIADNEDTREPGPGTLTVQTAVLCSDDPTRPVPEDMQALLTQFNSVSDLFAEAALAQVVRCAGWPDSLAPLPEIRTSDAPRSLIIGGRQDAQTPFAWAEAMSIAIGGELLSSDHPGHTVAFSGKSTCVDEAVLAFLIDGTLPDTLSCPAP